MKISRRKRRVLQMEALQRVVGYQSRSIHQMAGEVLKLKVLLEEAREKACIYQSEVCRYKGEVSDLTVRCHEVEEMLRQEEAKHEISNRRCDQYIEELMHYKMKSDALLEEIAVIRGKAKSYEKEIDLLVEDKLLLGKDLKEEIDTNKAYGAMILELKEIKKMYFGALNKCIDENNELKSELVERKKPFLKRVLGWR